MSAHPHALRAAQPAPHTLLARWRLLEGPEADGGALGTRAALLEQRLASKQAELDTKAAMVELGTQLQQALAAALAEKRPQAQALACQVAFLLGLAWADGVGCWRQEVDAWALLSRAGCRTSLACIGCRCRMRVSAECKRPPGQGPASLLGPSSACIPLAVLSRCA